MPASARRSMVSSVSVRPGLSQPRGGLPVKSLIAEIVSAIARRWSSTLCIGRWTKPWPMNSQPASLAEHLDEAPEADPHAVLVPGPVRQVGQERLAHRRRQDGARHRAGRAPVLDVDDGPDRDAGVARKLQRTAAVDRLVGDPPPEARADLVHAPPLRGPRPLGGYEAVMQDWHLKIASAAEDDMISKGALLRARKRAFPPGASR